MNPKSNSNFILLWVSQSVSQFGSAMTGYALIIWAYQQQKTAMTISLLSFFSFVPYVLVGIFAGGLVDRWKKKKTMLIADTVSECCTVAVFFLLHFGLLQVWHLYLINSVIGVMNAFQSPASNVALGMLVPEGKYTKMSGMNTFSNSLTAIVTPMAATTILSLFGLSYVLLVDVASFITAFVLLLLLIRIPEGKTNKPNVQRSILSHSLEGMKFLFSNRGLFYLILCFAVMNLFSSMTYENILPAMILSRTNGSEQMLGAVSGTIGFGGVVGGLVVVVFPMPKNKVKVIFYSAGISFLFGDVLMGLGQNIFVWVIAAIAASVPIAFVNGAQTSLLYHTIPIEIQGRVFAVKNAFQYVAKPIGLLMGGFLADTVFEPFMRSVSPQSTLASRLVGTGQGSGMACMFLLTGILGGVFCLWLYQNRSVRSLENEN